MRVTGVGPTPVWRSYFRFMFPIVVAGLTGLASGAVLVWPNDQWQAAARNSIVQLIAMAGGLCLLVWFLGFSGLAWKLRLGGLAMLVGAGASVKQVNIAGGFPPILSFRWERSVEDIDEESRRQRSGELLDADADSMNQAQTDFAEYRGRRRNGVVFGPLLARDWKTRPPRLLWRQPIGGGYSGFAVFGDAAVTLEQRHDQEAVVCYDTATGRQRWEFAYPAHFREFLGSDGPRATPTIWDGDVYSLGAVGRLVCLDLAGGKEKWSVQIVEEEDNIRFGQSGSPLVYGDVVVVNPGVQGRRTAGQGLVAYDRRTGQLKWGSGGTPAGYSSPMLASVGGRRQILLFDGQEIAGYDAQNGEKLWHHHWETCNGINVAQPLVLKGDRVFISSGYGVGCAMLAITRSHGSLQVEEKWSNRRLRCKFASPVLHEGYIYGFDEDALVCLDAQTGDRKWRGPFYGHGQLLIAGDLLVILSEKRAKLVIVEATPHKFRELGTVSVFPSKTWNQFALAGGKAYLRNDREMACFDLRAE